MAGNYLRKRIKNTIKAISIPFKKLVEIPWYFRRAYNRFVIKDRSFTVISNNCWAGSVYRYIGMPYLSPTVGLYFFADDYIRFIYDLRRYVSTELTFITADESNHKEELYRRHQQDRPIGVLGDIEIVFLHYGSREEAKEKWDRRKARINYDNLIFKFSVQNGCSEEHMVKFDALPFEKKVLISGRRIKKYGCEVFWKGEIRNGEIVRDTLPFPGNIKLKNIINK